MNMTTEKHKKTLQLKANEVMAMMLENPKYLDEKSRKYLIEDIKEKFGYRSRQAYRLYSLAAEMMLQVKAREVEKNLDRALLDREFLISQAKKEKDYKLLLEILRDRDKLLGLYVDKTKTDLMVRSIDMSNFTDYGLERIAKGEEITEVMQDPNSYRLVVGPALNA